MISAACITIALSFVEKASPFAGWQANLEPWAGSNFALAIARYRQERKAPRRHTARYKARGDMKLFRFI
jgi:hypothetical protein